MRINGWFGAAAEAEADTHTHTHTSRAPLSQNSFAHIHLHNIVGVTARWQRRPCWHRFSLISVGLWAAIQSAKSVYFGLFRNFISRL